MDVVERCVKRLWVVDDGVSSGEPLDRVMDGGGGVVVVMIGGDDAMLSRCLDGCWTWR